MSCLYKVLNTQKVFCVPCCPYCAFNLSLSALTTSCSCCSVENCCSSLANKTSNPSFGSIAVEFLLQAATNFNVRSIFALAENHDIPRSDIGLTLHQKANLQEWTISGWAFAQDKRRCCDDRESNVVTSSHSAARMVCVNSVVR
jgi:hypothetical protein